MDKLPDSILRIIGSYVAPIDRFRLQATCKRFKEVYSTWTDVAVDIRAESYGFGKFSYIDFVEDL